MYNKRRKYKGTKTSIQSHVYVSPIQINSMKSKHAIYHSTTAAPHNNTYRYIYRRFKCLFNFI